MPQQAYDCTGGAQQSVPTVTSFSRFGSEADDIDERVGHGLDDASSGEQDVCEQTRKVRGNEAVCLINVDTMQRSE